jgi:hypothetical protein
MGKIDPVRIVAWGIIVVVVLFIALTILNSVVPRHCVAKSGPLGQEQRVSVREC